MFTIHVTVYLVTGTISKLSNFFFNLPTYKKLYEIYGEMMLRCDLALFTLRVNALRVNCASALRHARASETPRGASIARDRDATV